MRSIEASDMYRICGTGYAGPRPIPMVIDYTVRATSRDQALEKLRQLGITVIHYTITPVR